MNVEDIVLSEISQPARHTNTLRSYLFKEFIIVKLIEAESEQYSPNDKWRGDKKDVGQGYKISVTQEE